MVTISKLSDDPAVAAAGALLIEKKEELARTQCDRELLAASRPDVSVRDRAALALLGDTSAQVPVGNLAELDKKVADLRRAVEIQTDRYNKACREASYRIAEDCKPQYAALVKRGIKALAALRQYIVEEQAFRQTLLDGDIQFASVMRPMAIPNFDETDIDNILAEAREYYGVGA